MAMLVSRLTNLSIHFVSEQDISASIDQTAIEFTFESLFGAPLLFLPLGLNSPLM